MRQFFSRIVGVATGGCAWQPACTEAARLLPMPDGGASPQCRAWPRPSAFCDAENDRMEIVTTAWGGTAAVLKAPYGAPAPAGKNCSTMMKWRQTSHIGG